MFFIHRNSKMDSDYEILLDLLDNWNDDFSNDFSNILNMSVLDDPDEPHAADPTLPWSCPPVDPQPEEVYSVFLDFVDVVRFLHFIDFGAPSETSENTEAR